MSANNVLYLMEQSDGSFKAYDWDSEAPLPTRKDAPNFESASLREAIVRAREYMSRNVVEYGFDVVLRGEA